jgi:NTP pyrophosphatase (non-canonical NTP hydrolase)
MKFVTNSEYEEFCDLLLARTDSPKGHRDLLLFLGLKLAEEVGEVSKLLVCGLFRDKRNTRENLREELGDVLFFVAMLARAKGFSLGDLMASNVEKLDKRYGHIKPGENYAWFLGELRKD